MFLKQQFAHITGIMLDISGMNSRFKVVNKVIHTLVADGSPRYPRYTEDFIFGVQI